MLKGVGTILSSVGTILWSVGTISLFNAKQLTPQMNLLQKDSRRTHLKAHGRQPPRVLVVVVRHPRRLRRGCIVRAHATQRGNAQLALPPRSMELLPLPLDRS